MFYYSSRQHITDRHMFTAPRVAHFGQVGHLFGPVNITSCSQTLVRHVPPVND